MEEIINLEETYNISMFRVEVNVQLVKIIGDEKTVLRIDECFTDPDEIDSFRKKWLRLEFELNGWCDIDELNESLLSYKLAQKVCLELNVWIPAEDLSKNTLNALKICNVRNKLEDIRRLFNTAKESREEKMNLIKSLLS